MSPITLHHYAYLAAALFSVGMAGVLLRRNFLTVLMSIELMANAANVLFVAAARHWGGEQGHVLVLFVIAVAACEAAVGLAIAVSLHRQTGAANPDALAALKG